MFLAGTIQALVLMSYWALELGGRHLGLWAPPDWPLLMAVPPSVLHALFMTCGVFPFFMFGFILTAGPRWQGAGDVVKRDFVPGFLLMAAGWLVVWAALVLPGLLAPGLALVLIGWSAVALTLTRIARFRATDRAHIAYVCLAVWLGAVGLGGFLAFAAGAPLQWARLGIALAVWGFLLPVFLSVAHRMLPFFTASAVRGYTVRRPVWALRVLICASLVHGSLSFFEFGRWLWLADLPAMAAALILTWNWWHRAVMANRMLAVLHVAFAWLGVAFGLYAVQSLATGAMPGLLAQAPLHALSLGFFASMLIGMASRVTLGHSGAPVVADDAMWRAFWMMQAAAALRVFAELPALPGAQTLLWLSSVMWIGAFALWAWRYAPCYWRPRIDGKAG